MQSLNATGLARAAPGLEDLKQRGFWTSVSDLLLMFPLTQPVRLVLLDMLCAGSPPPQVRPTLTQQPYHRCLHIASLSALLLHRLANAGTGW